jgi:hypothetical protein
MRWKSKPTSPELKFGDIRFVRKFAFWPKEATDGQTYWLESTWVRQRVIEKYDPAVEFEIIYRGWSEGIWVGDRCDSPRRTW